MLQSFRFLVRPVLCMAAVFLSLSLWAQQQVLLHYNFGRSGAVTYANGPEKLLSVNGTNSLRKSGQPFFFADAPADKKLNGEGSILFKDNAAYTSKDSFAVAGSPFILELWLQANARQGANDPGPVFATVASLGNGKKGYQLAQKGFNWVLLVDSVEVKTPLAAIQPGEWTHIALVSDSKNGTVYVNGQKKNVFKPSDKQVAGFSIGAVERDIIIMSVCYGHDSNKKMLMNFGPINRKGGEKRLNVIFSRAKKHMAIVSSIRHHHITNDYNDGANYFKRFLQYAEMVSTGNMNAAHTILLSLNTKEQKKKQGSEMQSRTTTQIKNALESRGYIVDQQIGQSSFKCTLGVKKNPGDTQYSLGIMIDDEQHYENNDLVEQYYQRPSILKSFGWQVITVYAKDWLEDSNRVMNLLVRHIESEPGKAEEDAIEKGEVVKQSEKIESDLIFTVLHSAEGDKFWEIAQDNTRLQIRSGKTGSRGLVQIKSFSTELEAASGKEQLIEEQIRLGFSRAHP